MKNIINGISNKYLILGFILLGASLFNGCTAQSKTISNSNQTVKITESNKVADIPKTSPTIEVVEKEVSEKPLETESSSTRSTDTKSNKVKVGGMAADKVSKENFDKINVGMTHDEVTRIFDDNGMQTSEMHINGRHTEMFMWSNDNYSKRINVTFEKDKVTEKNQSGL